MAILWRHSYKNSVKNGPLAIFLKWLVKSNDKKKTKFWNKREEVMNTKET